MFFFCRCILRQVKASRRRAQTAFTCLLLSSSQVAQVQVLRIYIFLSFLFAFSTFFIFYFHTFCRYNCFYGLFIDLTFHIFTFIYIPAAPLSPLGGSNLLLRLLLWCPALCGTYSRLMHYLQVFFVLKFQFSFGIFAFQSLTIFVCNAF